MNKKKLLAFFVSSAFLFAACGNDDSPSSPRNSDTEISSSSDEDDECDSDECDEKSSSSKKSDKKSSSSTQGDDDDDGKSSSSQTEEKSSASKDKSSSSKKDEKSSSSAAEPISSASVTSSSSVETPQGARVAKLEDLPKNIKLDLFGQEVFLATGSKQGFLSLRIPDELWVITFTDFANGEVKFDKDNVGIQYSDTDAAKAIKNKLEDGFKISFIVDKDGTAKYAVNDSKTFNEVVESKVSLQSGKISKAEVIKDKVYSCTDGDTTRTWKFFDNSYVVENGVGDKVAYWTAGRYDIQRSTLLMRPVYYNSTVYSMYAYSVGDNKTITTMDGKSMSCNVEDMADLVYQDGKKYVGEWQSVKDEIEWKFTIKADGTYEISAFKKNENVEAKSGVWEIYGNQLMMRNKGCLHPDKCTSSIYGTLKAGSANSSGELEGFTFSHSDTDTPTLPTSFEAPQYE